MGEFHRRQGLNKGITVEKVLEAGDHTSCSEAVLSHIIKVLKTNQIFAFLAPINL